jgi:uracil-DNA glycosylase
MIDARRKQAFRTLAKALDRIDLEVYAEFGKDPLEPIVGLGDPNCRIGFFGRDPGKDEVRHGMPFIGAGGQKVRKELFRRLEGGEMASFEASVAVGKPFFWANTVPYKPQGNKAWSMKAKKAFQPLMAELLIDAWQGREMITLGREAFLWFAILQPREIKQGLEAFWAREDRFETYFESELQLADGRSKRFRLHPLPHPSPLNATWYGRFPRLLAQRLEQLDVTTDNLRL